MQVRHGKNPLQVCSWKRWANGLGTCSYNKFVVIKIFLFSCIKVADLDPFFLSLNLFCFYSSENFDPFVVSARDKAFFIKWFPATYPLEVGYVWSTSDIKPVNMGVGAGLMSVTMQVKGYTDE